MRDTPLHSEVKSKKDKAIVEALIVTITDIKVDDTWFSFNYVVERGGKKSAGEYSEDYEGGDDKAGFRKLLKSGLAVDLALDAYEM